MILAPVGRFYPPRTGHSAVTPRLEELNIALARAFRGTRWSGGRRHDVVDAMSGELET